MIDLRQSRGSVGRGFVFRTVFVAAVVGVMIAVVLLPFWMALIKYPVTQAPIPHPSRANYLLSPQWGLNYFIVPYGAMILALPFIFFRGCSIRRLRPLIWAFGWRFSSESDARLRWPDSTGARF